MHLKLSAVKHRPGGRNDSHSPPKPRRSDASESGEVWFFNMDLCACQKGLCEKTCRLCWNNTMNWCYGFCISYLMSLFCSLQRWGGRVQVMGLCVCVSVSLYVFAHHGCEMVGTWLFLGHWRTPLLCISEEEKGGKGSTADSVQQRRQYRRQNQQSTSGYHHFFLMLHHTCLSSLPFALSSSHTCACNESCWL